jgi:hypothetical protein
MANPVSTITQGKHAAHTSGNRPESAIAYGIIHSTEVADPIHGDESVANYFASAGSGGSTQYVVDNDSTTQTLPDSAVAWGAPPLNTSGIHIEQSGKAAYTRAKWLAVYGPQIERVAWLMAHLSKKHTIPMRWLTAADLVRLGANPKHGKGGWTTHRRVSAAWHKSDHTDPGAGYPLDILMSKALVYRAEMDNPAVVPPTTTPPIVPPKQPVVKPYPGHLIKQGHKHPDEVIWIQRRLTAHGIKTAVDGVFGSGTADSVRAFRRRYHWLGATVGPQTWAKLAQ